MSADLRRIRETLEDPTASGWLKMALRLAILRDPVDAANDAAALAELLDGFAREANAR